MLTDELKEKIVKNSKELYNEGVSILFDELEKEGQLPKSASKNKKKKKVAEKLTIPMRYQEWYSKSIPVIEQFLPERLTEFIELYKTDKRKDITFATYSISDYMIGLIITRGGEKTFNTLSAFSSKFQLQLSILHSVQQRVQSILSEIEGILQYNLFESELSASADLLKKKHFRSSGVLAGVTLESHFKKVLLNHKLKSTKQNPTLSEYNEILKNNNIIDIPTWRLIQRLSDIRNLCAHSKDRDPKIDEVEDLINGVKKIISSIN